MNQSSVRSILTRKTLFQIETNYDFSSAINELVESHEN